MKVIVLGASGMLGHKMFQVLRTQFPGTLGTLSGERRRPPLDKVELLQVEGVIDGLDAADSRALEALLSSRTPDVVVNCVGIVKQRKEASLPLQSITINALLPHLLTKMCSAWGGRVIHVSTDCVFDGKRGAYTELDLPNAEDLYGQTKALGEIGRWGEATALTLRTSIIGRELTNFRSLLEWFLAQRGGSVRGFTRAIYSGVTTNHLAELVAKLITEHPDLTGLFHVASRPICKYDLLCLVRDAFGCDITITPDDSLSCDRSLRGNRLREAIGYHPPTWDQLIRELATDPTPYERWRT